VMRKTDAEGEPVYKRGGSSILYQSIAQMMKQLFAE